ncbi:MAG: hypothetical protein H6523_15100 [Mycolicibacterium sp.]|nr:hypothetical protein [Mycolicibacterium sp.]
MSGGLEVTPEALSLTSMDLAGVSGRLKGVLSSLSGKLAGEGAAWGDDKIGHEFANGSNGYLGQVEWVQGSIDAKADLLDGYSEALHKAAIRFEQADGTQA